MLEYTVIPAPIGSIIVVASGDTVRNIYMTSRTGERAQAWTGQVHPDAAYRAGLMPDFAKQIRTYFAGKPVRFDVDFDISHMTPFQQKVLNACARVDYGQTLTYGDLARRIGHPNAGRAVGAALGRNPLPLVIPCHRVVGCNGGLGGFSAEQGITVKRWLLDLETGARPAAMPCAIAV